MAVTEVLCPVGGLQLPGLFSTFTCWLPLQPQGVGVHALNNPTALDKTHRAQAAGTPAIRAECAVGSLVGARERGPTTLVAACPAMRLQQYQIRLHEVMSAHIRPYAII